MGLMNWINTFGEAYYLGTLLFSNTIFGKNEGMRKEKKNGVWNVLIKL